MLAALIWLVTSIVVHADPVQSLREWLSKPADARSKLREEGFAAQPLSRDQANEASKLLIADRLAEIRSSRAKEWNDRLIVLGDKQMKWLVKSFGEKPETGHSLLISMHGGGGAPHEVNEQQWENQIKLYQLKEGIVIAPRAPTDNWNLWHEAHIDAFFDRLIEDAIAIEGVNPNRIYLTGYSAGGDGTYQLAPRMADRFAGAAMMAGHPNEASPLGLRNLPFAIHVGALDSAYSRNTVAAEWGRKLDDLQKADPEGYVHQWKLHDGRSHWMNREDREGIEWIMTFSRNPLPKKVVWKQDDVIHTRFYWLSVPSDEAKTGNEIVASINGQTIEIQKSEGVTHLTILLSDAMVDLDRAVTVKLEGKQVFTGKAIRSIGEIASSLEMRCDPSLAFNASVQVQLKD
jgi:poly(3-hydroxybutyrate) depolymerase